MVVAAPLNIIDFVAILPFYIELATSGTGARSSAAVIRIVRLVRIFRIFKVARYLPWVRIFANALALSVQPLLMLVLIVLIAMTVFSSIMYYAERGEWNDAAAAFVRYDSDGNAVPSPFQSIPLAMWWAIITMTTGLCSAPLRSARCCCCCCGGASHYATAAAVRRVCVCVTCLPPTTCSGLR